MRIRFPKLPGRSYAYRSTAETGEPDPETGARGPVVYLGEQPDAISVPASRRVIDRDAGSPGRSFLGNTEADLQSGVAPNHIDRATPASNAGIIGRGVAGWPYDGNALFVPHIVIPRTPITVTPFARTIDTGVTIPSVAIGGPVT